MKYINLTPRWTEILPTWLMLFESAARGDCRNPDIVKGDATQELRRMAQAADRYGDLLAFVRDSKGWSDATISSAIAIGRGINESERNTVKESNDV